MNYAKETFDYVELAVYVLHPLESNVFGSSSPASVLGYLRVFIFSEIEVSTARMAMWDYWWQRPTLSNKRLPVIQRFLKNTTMNLHTSCKLLGVNTIYNNSYSLGQFLNDRESIRNSILYYWCVDVRKSLKRPPELCCHTVL